MSGLAAGLARGLAMYGQGRMIAEEREAERQRQEAERQRQMAMMKLQQDQFALQREQFEAGQRQTALANKRVAESDTNEAIGKGFRPVGDQWDTFNDLVGIDPSKAETITVNGQTMRKVAPTQAFQQGIIQRREQENELQRKVAEEKQRREQILGTIKDGPMRALAAQLPLDELQKLTSGRLKDMMTPKAGPAPLTERGDDGSMYFSTDGGRSWQRSRVQGYDEPPVSDATAPQSVPTMAPRSALDTIPGSGFSRAAQPVAAAQPPQRQPAAPRVGPFGKTGTPKDVSPDEIKAAGFAQRMEQSAQAINSFEDKGANPVRDGVARGLGVLPIVGESLRNSATDPNRQKYWTAADNWIRANLRKESGAAIGSDEMEGERRTYFPMPGDDPATIAYKRELRQTTEAAMRQMAGRAYTPWTPPQQSQNSGGLTALERIYFGGRR